MVSICLSQLYLAGIHSRHSNMSSLMSYRIMSHLSPDSNGPVSPFPLLLLALSSLCFICFLTLFSLQVFLLDSIYSPQSPECVVLLAILMSIRSLSFRPSTVVRYYMKCTGLLRSWMCRVESEQKLWVLVHFCRGKKCKTVCNFYLDLHYIMRTIYSSGSRTIWCIIESRGGRQCCFMSLSALLLDRLWPQLVVIGLQKTWPISWNLEPNGFRFFAGKTYTRYRNAFHKQSPFISLYVGLQRAAKRSACRHHRHRLTLAQTKDIY